jgi:hypothetical protein
MNRNSIPTTLRSAAALLLALGAGTAAARDRVAVAKIDGAVLVSSESLCTTAAMEAKRRALAAGIDESRLGWLYGIKPFEEVAHVSLVIDGKLVIDNGGLGRNLWGGAICPDNVCTLKEARRGYDESFIESARLAVRDVWPEDGTMIAKRR